MTVKQQRVLLAEDSIFNQKIISNMLTRLNVTVEIANNGQEVLDKCAQYSYALVLMDCQMPLLDGHHAARCLRQREQAQGLSHMPIIAITSDDSQDLEACLDAGMDDYLLKPILLKQLEAVLMRWL